MKLILDAMMPREISSHLPGHEVWHATQFGWQELQNGVLLQAAESEGFDVLLTKDTNLPYQQNMTGRNIAVLVLRPNGQSLTALFDLVPQISGALDGLTPGAVVRVTATNPK